MDPQQRADSPGLDTTDVRERMELLTMFGYGFLESGQTGGQTERRLMSCARSLGIDGLSLNFFGRVLLAEATRPDGTTVSVTGAARSLDAIDCTRSRVLNEMVEDLAADARTSTRLAAVRAAVQAARDAATPWWVTTLGMTMLAFFISMQVGVTWQAWVATAFVQLLTSLTGFGAARLRMPRLFAAALQCTAGGAFATLLVQLGFVDPVGAAAALAVSWLLVLPLPQVIGAVTDAIDADYLSALTRIASVAMTAAGILIGGALTFELGELLGMQHPSLSELPSLPWYLGLVFAALGAIANAFANGGRLSLVGPAALLGLLTSATNQALLAAGLPLLWANSVSAAVLGVATVWLADRTGYPQQVLALMGITGALLPGLPVFFGILLEMGGSSGLQHFGDAGAICLGIGTGVALGIYLAGLWDRSPLPGSPHRRLGG